MIVMHKVPPTFSRSTWAKVIPCRDRSGRRERSLVLGHISNARMHAIYRAIYVVARSPGEPVA